MLETALNVSTEEFLMRRRRQFLVHSFLYYRMNENLISDQKYDAICKELAQLQKDYPELSRQLPYHDLCSKVDESGSGFYINDYPVEIMATACRLLAKERHEDVQNVLTRVGLRVLPPNHQETTSKKRAKKK